MTTATSTWYCDGPPTAARPGARCRSFPEGNGSTHGNPVPIVDQKTGRILLVSTHNGPNPCPNGCDRDPYVQTSDDNGAT